MFKYTSSLYYFNQRSTFEAHFVKLHSWNLLPLLNGGWGGGGGGGARGGRGFQKLCHLGGVQNFLLVWGDKPEKREGGLM